jgi:hypothetical protein
LNVFAALSSINIGKITHVRLIDVVGNKDAFYPARDKNGRKIIDPWPTPFPSSGFDLDAVGVINQLYNTNIFQAKDFPFLVYPNPINAQQNLIINNLNNASVSINDLQGKTLFTDEAKDRLEIENNFLLSGIYILNISQQNKVYHQKIIIN